MGENGFNLGLKQRRRKAGERKNGDPIILHGVQRDGDPPMNGRWQEGVWPWFGNRL